MACAAVRDLFGAAVVTHPAVKATAEQPFAEGVIEEAVHDEIGESLSAVSKPLKWNR